jgi:hypothetical protein
MLLTRESIKGSKIETIKEEEESSIKMRISLD